MDPAYRIVSSPKKPLTGKNRAKSAGACCVQRLGVFFLDDLGYNGLNLLYARVVANSGVARLDWV